MKLAITEDYTNNMGNRPNKFNVRRNSYSDENSFMNAIKTKIPSFNVKYVNKLEIKEDKLHYIGEDENERQWLAEVINVAGMLKINYVYENGTQASTPYQQVITDGSYEVTSPTIEGYEPDYYIVSGEIQGDTNITVTYYGESQGLAYEELADGTYTVAGIGNFTGENLVIPKKNNNKDVTQIKKEAFRYNTTIKKLIIPNTVLNIGDSCFERCNLEQVNLNAIKLDGSDHFESTKLNTVTIGRSVEQLGTRPFYQCNTINEINYLGTIDEWNSITKTNIKEGSSLKKINCTDGIINL